MPITFRWRSTSSVKPRRTLRVASAPWRPAPARQRPSSKASSAPWSRRRVVSMHACRHSAAPMCPARSSSSPSPTTSSGSARLANMIIGREGLKPNELADHHTCRLGKWYDGCRHTALAGSPEFVAIEDPHARVHSHGIEAVRRYNAGRHPRSAERTALRGSGFGRGARRAEAPGTPRGRLILIPVTPL